MGRRRRGRAKRTGNLKAATVPVFRVSEECKQVHKQIYFSEGVPSKKMPAIIIQGHRRVCIDAFEQIALPHCTLHPTGQRQRRHQVHRQCQAWLCPVTSAVRECTIRLIKVTTVLRDYSCAVLQHCSCSRRLLPATLRPPSPAHCIV